MMFTIRFQLTLFLSFIALSKTFQTSSQKSSSPIISFENVPSSFSKTNTYEKGICYSASCIFMNNHGAGLIAVDEGKPKSNTISPDQLPPPPCPKSNPNDDSWRTMRQNVPIWVQNNLMRDSGFLRSSCDMITTFAVPSFQTTYRQALPTFLALTDFPVWLRRHIFSLVELDDDQDEFLVHENTFETIKYGDHPMQIAHLMKPLFCENGGTTYRGKDRLIVFIHGGAWGSGLPWMYRLVARPLLQLNHTVAVIGYRTYPDADVFGQVEDVKLATEKLLQLSPKFAGNDVAIIGHSSGAHIGLLSILDRDFLRRVPLGAFVSLSGVFDIVKHFKWETGRGIEEISPLKGACGGSEKAFMRCSPTYLVEDFIKTQGSSLLPKMLFLHGALDDIVPYTSTTELTRELHKGITGQPSEKQRFQTLILPKVGHADTIIQFMMGGETRDHVLRWLSMESDFSKHSEE